MLLLLLLLLLEKASLHDRGGVSAITYVVALHTAQYAKNEGFSPTTVPVLIGWLATSA